MSLITTYLNVELPNVDQQHPQGVMGIWIFFANLTNFFKSLVEVRHRFVSVFLWQLFKCVLF